MISSRRNWLPHELDCFVNFFVTKIHQILVSSSESKKTGRISNLSWETGRFGQGSEERIL